MYEILKASTSHSEDAIRAGIASERPDWNVDEIKLVDGEWRVQISKDETKTADKPPFLQDKEEAPVDDAPEDDALEDDGAEDKSDDKSDKDDAKSDGDKGKEKPKGDVVSELKGLMDQLNDIVKQVQDKAGEAADETAEHRDKLDQAKDALGDDAGGLPGEDAPAPPLPDAAMPGAGGPPKGGPKRPGIPSGPKSVIPGRPGLPGGGGPGMATFTNTEVATHPGVDEKGARISLVAAAAQLESDPDFAEYEVVGMVENNDGTYSAKLKKKN